MTDTRDSAAILATLTERLRNPFLSDEQRRAIIEQHLRDWSEAKAHEWAAVNERQMRDLADLQFGRGFRAATEQRMETTLDAVYAAGHREGFKKGETRGRESVAGAYQDALKAVCDAVWSEAEEPGLLRTGDPVADAMIEHFELSTTRTRH